MWPFVAIYVPKVHGDIPPSLMVLLLSKHTQAFIHPGKKSLCQNLPERKSRSNPRQLSLGSIVKSPSQSKSKDCCFRSTKEKHKGPGRVTLGRRPSQALAKMAELWPVRLHKLKRRSSLLVSQVFSLLREKHPAFKERKAQSLASLCLKKCKRWDIQHQSYQVKRVKRSGT